MQDIIRKEILMARFRNQIVTTDKSSNLISHFIEHYIYITKSLLKSAYFYIDQYSLNLYLVEYD